MRHAIVLLVLASIDSGLAAAQEPSRPPARVLGLVPAPAEEKGIDPAEVVALVAPLAHAEADDLLSALREFLGPPAPEEGGEVRLVRSASANALVISAPYARIPYLRDLIRSLDEARAGRAWVVEIVETKAPADAIAQAVQEILRAESGAPGPPKADPKGAADPRPGARVLSIAGSNRLAIAAPSGGDVRRIRAWIEGIEAPEGAGPEIVREILPLKALRAERAIELASAMLIGAASIRAASRPASAAARSTVRPSPGAADQRLIQFPERNVLIFQGLAEELEDVRKILALIDVEPAVEEPPAVTRVFRLKVLRPQRAADIIAELAGAKASAAARSSGSPPIPTRPATSIARTPSGTSPSLPRLVPNEEGDCLIFQGTEAEAEEVRKILDLIDREEGPR